MTILKVKNDILSRFDQDATPKKNEIQDIQNRVSSLFLGKQKRTVLDLPGVNLQKCNKYFGSFRSVYLIEKDKDIYDYIRKNRHIVETKTTLFYGNLFKAITLMNGPGKVSLVNYDGMSTFNTGLFNKLLSIIQDHRMAMRCVLRMTFCTRKITRAFTEERLNTLKRSANKYWEIELDRGFPYAEGIGKDKNGIPRFGAPMYTTQWLMRRR